MTSEQFDQFKHYMESLGFGVKEVGDHFQVVYGLQIDCPPIPNIFGSDDFIKYVLSMVETTLMRDMQRWKPNPQITKIGEPLELSVAIDENIKAIPDWGKSISD